MGSIIPIIDLQDFPGQSEKLVEACKEWGIFRIINDEALLPFSLRCEMKEVIESLMEHHKRNVNRNTGENGYFPPKCSDPLYDTIVMTDLTSPEAFDSFCKGASFEQRNTIIKYGQAVQQMIIYIGSKLGEALGIKNFSIEGWPALLRINRYSFTKETIGRSGMQTHSDTGFFTLLDDDIYGGLQIMDKSGSFQLVEPMPGTFLVIVGDIGTAWSNGRLKNAIHRVTCKEAGVRISIATFLLGPRDALIEAPDEFVDSEHPRLYAPFLEENYRKLRILRKAFVGEAFDLLRDAAFESVD